ncbi:MAG: hypothetical protein Q8L68_00555, partial [Methylococcales bacterium]|nr:hypothetical protein [Methylococcales bacterium]
MESRNLSGLRETILAVYGHKGELWWSNLPQQLEELSSEHHLTLQPPFQDLSFNYVAPALGPNQESWVLKCGVPHDEFSSEIHALRHYAGQGAVRLIQA